MATYGKLKSDNTIEYMPDVLVYQDVTYKKFDGEFPIEVIHGCGYKEIVNTNPPEQQLPKDYHWESHWIEKEETIETAWVMVEDDTTPEQRRSNAYQTRPMIEFGNGIITVDEARNICEEYVYEDTERAQAIITELRAKITAAKQAIREEYPNA